MTAAFPRQDRQRAQELAEQLQRSLADQVGHAQARERDPRASVGELAELWRRAGVTAEHQAQAWQLTAHAPPGAAIDARKSARRYALRADLLTVAVNIRAAERVGPAVSILDAYLTARDDDAIARAR